MENFGELAEHKTQPANPVRGASSESTKVEQTRAFAEVAMQVDLAKKYPRNMEEVFRRIEETFERSPGLLLKAKWTFPRAGATLTGYTIQFARAIAECVGNIKYSFRELSRGENQSEMMVYAWDMETNTIQDRTIIIPHTRDVRGGKTKKLTHERDIYENNANVASRRLRECILGVLPAAARRKGEEVVDGLISKAFPEEKRQKYIDRAIAEFIKRGITESILIKERGNRPPETWTKNDIIALKTHVEDIDRGDKTADDIFGRYAGSASFDKSSHPEPEDKKEKPPLSFNNDKKEPKQAEEKEEEQTEEQAEVEQLKELLGDPISKNQINQIIAEGNTRLNQKNIDLAIKYNDSNLAFELIEIFESKSKK